MVSQNSSPSKADLSAGDVQDTGTTPQPALHPRGPAVTPAGAFIHHHKDVGAVIPSREIAFLAAAGRASARNFPFPATDSH
jgi:hypothetical protein